ncbi:hypothetical protein DA89_2327 [Vibrio paracholerae]|nr:hypothetical protein DA89_2327 [Vibrio paracholerae]
MVELERNRCFLMVFNHLVVTCGGFHREFNFRKLQIVRPIHINTRSRGCCHRGTRQNTSDTCGAQSHSIHKLYLSSLDVSLFTQAANLQFTHEAHGSLDRQYQRDFFILRKKINHFSSHKSLIFRNPRGVAEIKQS